jgi:hypothetical protein
VKEWARGGYRWDRIERRQVERKLMRQVEAEREVTVGRVMGDIRWERSDGKEMKTTGGKG